jgi:trans-aconitate methyltransferase
MSILDVGCGPGSNTELFLTGKCTGIDLNPEYISHAQKNSLVADF